ncbi:MAG TPA: beta-galactosidase [Mycobacteriales bacterium]|nr:beta-galactosidase [Mycobacteriales bacterium]
MKAMPWSRIIRSRSLIGFASVAAAATVLVPPAQVAAAAPAAPSTVSSQHTVSWDHYSIMVDGKRVLLWAGEFHYFRLPSPDLWRDTLEKIRAAGFNGVSLYFDWAYHSPKAGVYDFTGVRDVDRLLRMTEELGLYVVARPGPYINAEVSGGGLPAWLKNVPGRARSSAPGYTAAYRDWLHHINPIIARHQITRGGSVIAYNTENEYSINVDTAYMNDLQVQARAAGITVPITHNACCGGGLANWTSGEGAVQIPAVDDYPQSFDCPHPDVWGPWGNGISNRLRDDIPVFSAEYQAGAIDLFNAGYPACRDLTGPAYQKFFYKSNLVGSGATMFSYYMAYGGTNWGWLGQPNDVYTSYDYGAAITEARQLTTKYDEFKRQGYFVTTVAPLTKTDPAAAPASANPALATQARANPDTGTQFVLVRHADAPSTTAESSTLDWTAPDGRYLLPVQLTGRDAKVLVAGYDLGGQRLVLSSSEILTHVAVSGRDVAVLYGRDGESGRTVLRYSSAPSVTVLAGGVRSSFNRTTGDLQLDYVHSGLARVLISGGGRRPMLLLLGTDSTAAQFWRVPTSAGTMLVRGTSLVRSGSVRGDRLALRADTAAAGDVEVFGPSWLDGLTVGSDRVGTRRTSSGSLLGRVSGPAPVRLPALTGWRVQPAAPETDPRFNDAQWTVADHTSTPSGYTPKTQPVLFADDYGYHYGNVWYRGHFTATGAESAVSLNAITGRNGIYLAWLNGHFLGSANGGVQADADSDPPNANPGPADFAVPAGLLRAGQPAVLSVLVENMGHNDDWIAVDTRFRQPRGLFGASLVGSNAPISWRIQGARGGENLRDTARGALNTGGLFGERAGWYLPGFPDRSWPRVTTPAETGLTPGVTWYRTGFGLSTPDGQDVSVGLRFGDTSTRGYRVLVYLNGWQLGQYVNGGSQRDFVLPAGLLRQHGGNTLALAVISTVRDASGPGPVSLVSLGNQRGGVPVAGVPAPGYDRRQFEGS